MLPFYYLWYKSLNIVHMEILKIIFAVILPPVGAAMQVGITKHFWINVLLTILGFLPGLIHALWLIFKK